MRLAIFSILQYFVHLPAMASNVLTLVVIFLPLSSLWASASTTSQGSQPVKHRSRFMGSLTSRLGSMGPIVAGKDLNGPLSPSDTPTTKISSFSPPNSARTSKMYRDLEAQGMHGMDHFFGVSKA